MAYIRNAACASCTDFNYLETVFLQNFGLKVKNKSIYDMNSGEGQALISKYSLKFLPNAIITGDTNAYDALLQLWPQIGETGENNELYLTQAVIFQGQS